MEDLFRFCEQSQYDDLQNFIANEKTIFLKCVDSNTGETALHKCKSVRCADLVLENNPKLLNRQNKNGDTPLMDAIQQENMADMCQFYLRNGADTSIVNRENQLAHHLAAVYCQADVFDELLDCTTNSVELNLIDRQGCGVIHYIAQQKCAEAERMMNKLLTKMFVNIDLQDRLKRTPFLIATQAGNIGICRILRDHGCKLTAHDDQGMNALHCASATGNRAMVDYLVKDLSMPVNQADNIGRTALFYAVYQMEDDVVERLIQLKALVDWQDKASQTPLHIAAIRGSELCTSQLLNGKANPWIKDQDGRFPLHHAAEKGYRDLIRLLLKHEEAKARVGEKDNSNKTAVEIAHDNKFTDVVNLLNKFSTSEFQKPPQFPPPPIEEPEELIEKQTSDEEGSNRDDDEKEHNSHTSDSESSSKDDEENADKDGQTHSPVHVSNHEKPLSDAEAEKEENNQGKENENEAVKNDQVVHENKENTSKVNSDRKLSMSSTGSSKPESNVNEDLKMEELSEDDPYLKSGSKKTNRQHESFLERITSQKEEKKPHKKKKKPKKLPKNLVDLRKSLLMYDAVVREGKVKHSALKRDMQIRRYYEVSPERRTPRVEHGSTDKENTAKQTRARSASRPKSRQTNIDKEELQERLDRIKSETDTLLRESKSQNEEQQKLLDKRSDSRPASSMGQSSRPMSSRERSKSQMTFYIKKPYMRPESASRYMCYLPNIPQPPMKGTKSKGRPKSSKRRKSKEISEPE